MTLDNESKEILINLARSIVERFSIADLSELEKGVTMSGKERSWYGGRTLREFPLMKDHQHYNYQVETSSPSGSFATPHFREVYDEKKFRKEVTYKLTLHTSSPTNLSVELDTMEAVGTHSLVQIGVVGKNDKDELDQEEDFLEKGLLHSYENSGPIELNITVEQIIVIIYHHSLEGSQLARWGNRRMLGMRVRWEAQSSAEVSSPGSFAGEESNIQLRRLVNIVERAGQGAVWEVAERVRIDWLTETGYTLQGCRLNMVSQNTHQLLVDRIILNLTLTNDASLRDTNDSISEESLKAGAEIQYYLSNCPQANWNDIQDFLVYLVTQETPTNIVQTTNMLLTKALQTGREIEAEAFRTFLDELSAMLSLDHENIINFIRDGRLLDRLGNTQY